MTLRLILVDDQEMYRLGFRMLLETQEGVEVVGEAEDGRAAVDLIDRVKADIVLMDVRMPGRCRRPSGDRPDHLRPR